MTIITPLFELFVFGTIIAIMAFTFFYMHYFFSLHIMFIITIMAIKIIDIIRIIDIIAAIYVCPPPCTFKWYMATDTGFNSRKALVYI